MRTLDALWLDVFQQLTARVAHELRGALNGAGVNLEVVRSRSARANVEAASLTSFATAASDQFELAVAMTEALLVLGRAPRAADVGETAAQLVALLAPVARADGRALRLERDGGASPALTSAPPLAVRALAGGALLAALDATGDITCRLAADDEQTLNVAITGRDPLVLSDALLAAADATGVRVVAAPQCIALAFPPASGARPRIPERQ